jgi:hypothetical protein
MESTIVNWQPVQIYRPFRRHLFRGRLLAAHHRTLQVLPGRNLRDFQWKQGENISNSAATENGRIQYTRGIVAKFTVLDWGAKVSSCIGLSYRPARLHVGWRAGTTTLCRSHIYPRVRNYEFGFFKFPVFFLNGLAFGLSSPHRKLYSSSSALDTCVYNVYIVPLSP